MHEKFTVHWKTQWNLSCCTELVVAESVVVIKKLLQMQPEKHSDIIKHMAKLTDNIQVRVSSQTSHGFYTFVDQQASVENNIHLPKNRNKLCLCPVDVYILYPCNFISVLRCLWLGPVSCGSLESTVSMFLRLPQMCWGRWPSLSPMKRTLSSYKLSIWLPSCISPTPNRYGQFVNVPPGLIHFDILLTTTTVKSNWSYSI